MNREQRIAAAAETLEILQRGRYTAASGRAVEIHAWLHDAISRTRLYRPAEFPAELVIAARPFQTISTVTAETTLAAAQRLAITAAGDEPLCLNFASAKNPGGGFLSGAQAQEESLARSSGLYASIAPQVEMYEYNRLVKTCFYSDYMIYSPGVPVFRDDAGRLLGAPYRTAFITAPAVNAGVVRQRELTQLPLLRPTMKQRLQRLLWVAHQHGHTRLVLGAWGCGVFANDPYEIAALFAETLGAGGPFDGCFRAVVYAIYDRTNNRAVFAPFEKRLGTPASPLAAAPGQPESNSRNNEEG
ncbi:MAG: TIGR02452 family protein [Acidobacteria bacterium]|nr:TIGR02452 family protein [Acidobacteriota bacterium]MBI3424422.1 TIGR02452 family protein [Acidobacteriota bacterium]